MSHICIHPDQTNDMPHGKPTGNETPRNFTANKTKYSDTWNCKFHIAATMMTTDGHKPKETEKLGKKRKNNCHRSGTFPRSSSRKNTYPTLTSTLFSSNFIHSLWEMEGFENCEVSKTLHFHRTFKGRKTVNTMF